MTTRKLESYINVMRQLDSPCTAKELAEAANKAIPATRLALFKLCKNGSVGRKLMPGNGTRIRYYLKDIKENK
jgi:predicted transcriptional regulator